MQQSSTSCEKATILITTVRQLIKISPKQFNVFLDILSEQAWMKGVMEELKMSLCHEQSRKDAVIQPVNTGDRGFIDRCKSADEISTNGEDYRFPQLNSEGKAELEAQLILSADIELERNLPLSCSVLLLHFKAKI